MKALTLTQPWATLVTIGAKRIETRSWSTNYRGPLAIHAAKGYPREARVLFFKEPFKTALRQFDVRETGVATPLPQGYVIATCELVEVSNPISLATSWHGCTEYWKNKHCFSLTEQERAFGDYSEGRYMWLLENVKMLDKPMLAKGSLGLWNWEMEA